MVRFDLCFVSLYGLHQTEWCYNWILQLCINTSAIVSQLEAEEKYICMVNYADPNPGVDSL